MSRILRIECSETPSPAGISLPICRPKRLRPRERRLRAKRSATCAEFATAAAAVEFRFRDGNSMWFNYSWLGTWQYNPSEGLLLKFSGDLVYLVLIRGSNLDKPLKEGGHQSDACRPATPSRTLGPRDDRRGNPAGGGDGTDDR